MGTCSVLSTQAGVSVYFNINMSTSMSRRYGSNGCKPPKSYIWEGQFNTHACVMCVPKQQSQTYGSTQTRKVTPMPQRCTPCHTIYIMNCFYPYHFARTTATNNPGR
jgi:hypothetical protein